MKENKFNDFIKERILLHHTERDLIRVSIIRGKDHNHLELRNGDDVKMYKIKSLKKVLDKSISFLKKYKHG